MGERNGHGSDLGDMFSGAVEYQEKQLGLRYLSEEEYANQIRSLADVISPRRETFENTHLNAKRDDFGAWIFATTSSPFEESEPSLQTIRVNTQSKILTAVEPLDDNHTIEKAIADQDLDKDRKFVHFHVQERNGIERLEKYHRVEALIGRLQTEVVRRAGDELGYKIDTSGKITHDNLTEVLEAVSRACKKHPYQMKGFSLPLGFKANNDTIFSALTQAGFLSPLRAKAAKLLPMDLGFENGMSLRRDKQTGTLNLSFSPKGV